MRKFKHYALLLLIAVMALTTSCGEDYDDTAIKKDIADLQSRVEKLETWCTTVNGQISALQGLVTALEAKDYVTGVSPVENGYTITFSKSGAITIYNGKDGAKGADGITPTIGVDKDTDGLYYWTIKVGDADVKWLEDAAGNKIRTTGDAGKTPEISVATDTDGKVYWRVNSDWLYDANHNKVQATGDKGASGSAGTAGKDGDSIFKKDGIDLTDPNNVTFTLNDKDGTKITLPRTSAIKIYDSFDDFKIAELNTPKELTLALNVSDTDNKAIKAELTSSAGMAVAIKTRAAADPWGVDITAPTFKDGKVDIQPKVTITVKGATEGDIALLKVTVVDKVGKEHAETRVIVYSTQVDVENVELDHITLAVNVSEEKDLTATVIPVDATNKKVTWKSDRTDIATVTDGKVKGIAAGTAVITVTTEDGEHEATCTVTVSAIAVTGVKLDGDKSIAIGGTVKLAATVEPSNATNQEVSWESSNTTVATIGTDGTVTGIAAGETTITVTSKENGNITATCKVTVAEAPSGFKVGDYYPAGATSNNAVGVVFWLNPNDATKGKIVSMDESGEVEWSDAKAWAESVTAGSLSWALPSKDELQYIWCAYNGVSPVTWEKSTASPCPAKDEDKWGVFNDKLTSPFQKQFYWSSTEAEPIDGENTRWGATFTIGNTYGGKEAMGVRRFARAIASF